MSKDKRSAGARLQAEETRIPASAAGQTNEQTATLPSMAPELKAWPAKAEVAQRLGISTKTLERMIAAGKIEQAYISMPGRRPMAVINPRDVAELEATSATPKPFLIAPERTSDETAIAIQPRQPAGALPALFEALQGMARATAQPFFLTVDDAVAISGLPRGTLMRLIRDKNLPARRTGDGYRIHRRDLEQL